MNKNPAAKKPPQKKSGPYTVNGSLAIDIYEAARFTGFSVSSLYQRVAAGSVPYRKVQRRLLFDRDELRQWFQQLPGVTVDEALSNSSQ